MITGNFIVDVATDDSVAFSVNLKYLLATSEVQKRNINLLSFNYNMKLFFSLLIIRSHLHSPKFIFVIEM